MPGESFFDKYKRDYFKKVDGEMKEKEAMMKDGWITNYFMYRSAEPQTVTQRNDVRR